MRNARYGVSDAQINVCRLLFLVTCIMVAPPLPPLLQAPALGAGKLIQAPENTKECEEDRVDQKVEIKP